MKGQEIGFDSCVYDAISDETIKEKFFYDEDAGLLRRKLSDLDFTWRIQNAPSNYEVSAKAAYTSVGTISIGSKISEGARNLKVTRPWSE